MRKKQRLLLKTIEMSGRMSRMRLVKVMFLLSRDPRISERYPVYDFVPYRFGPFSFEMYSDLNRSMAKGFISERDETMVSEMGPDVEVDHRVASVLRGMLDDLDGVTDEELVQDIYDRFPELTIRSETGRREDYVRDRTGFISLGYQGLTVDAFIGRLIEHKVHQVVDVRKDPVSMVHWYRKERLRDTLAKFDIGYHHVPELGVDAEDRRRLVTHEDYRTLFRAYRDALGRVNAHLEEIIGMGEAQMVALTCYERDAARCHRGVISEAIRERGFEVEDI